MGLNKDLLLVIDSSGLGEGEPDLGERLMKAFLNVLLESEDLPARIICMNSGIFLTTRSIRSSVEPYFRLILGYRNTLVASPMRLLEVTSSLRGLAL